MYIVLEDSLPIMNEQELNTLMSVVSDPIKNVYRIESYKDLAEIQRIIRIFNISEEQNEIRELNENWFNQFKITI